MRAIASKFLVLWGWRRCLVAALFGCVAALAMPPFYIFIVLFVAYPVLVWLIDGAMAQAGSRRSGMLSAFATGWSFAFGFFLVSLHWVAEAFLVEADAYAWMIPFAVLGLPAYLALYWGAGVALAALAWQTGFGRILALAACLAVTEWLRGHLLTGFPWLMPGYAMGVSDALAQSAALFGVYGLNFIVILAGAAPAALADEPDTAGQSRLARLAGPMVSLMLLAAFAGAGAYRLSFDDRAVVDGMRLRIVQPNVEQGEKWRPENAPALLAGIIDLSDMATSPQSQGVRDVTHLVWPESAVPFLIAERPDVRAAIAALLPDDAVLLTGGLRREPAPPSAGGQDTFFNSLLVIDGTGDLVALYDKVHLVPFGEFLPFRDLLEPLGFRRLVSMPAGFDAGGDVRTLQVGQTPPFSPLICYEVIFPRSVADPSDRPEWLLNVTNDAWFGQSIGPHQHFAQARFRAIEEGLPLVRAANTGISAVIDPYGRIVKTLGLGRRGVLDSALPQALPPTPYSKLGDWFALFTVVAGLMVAIRFKLRKSNTNTAKSNTNRATITRNL